MGDEQSDNRPIINSFLHNEEHSNSSVESKLKRKLQYELEDATLPLSKYKFRDRLRVTNQDNVGWPENASVKSSLGAHAYQTVINGPRGELEESIDNENEDYDTTMTLDLDDEEDETSGESFPRDLPSISSSSTRNSVIGNSANPIDDENGWEASKRIREDLKDVLQTDKRSKGGDGHFGGLEGCDGYISEIQEIGVENIEEEIIDAMLYSNGILPSAYLDSSEKWNLEQDNLVQPKKPTIDQEFEQYFSMLML